MGIQSDIDDSDLHLTPVVRSSNSTYVKPSPYTTNPVTIIPGPSGVVHVSSSTRVEPSTSNLNPVRIIPGPAGLVQQAKLLKEKVFILDPDGALMSTQQYCGVVIHKDKTRASGYSSKAFGAKINVQSGGHDNILTTQEYVRKVYEDVSGDEHFMQGPWLSAIMYLYGQGVSVSGCLGDMKKYCIKGKLELVVSVVKSCTPNSLGDMTVTLKDPTGTMGGTIHCKIFQNETDGYAKSIKVGFVLILRNVSV
ncbi:transposase, MuDR, MULE transposase domain protein [Tanacetum coccineum]